MVVCGGCRVEVEPRNRFCGKCGQEVKGQTWRGVLDEMFWMNVGYGKSVDVSSMGTKELVEALAVLPTAQCAFVHMEHKLAPNSEFVRDQIADELLKRLLNPDVNT
jgi:hypothetical protein